MSKPRLILIGFGAGLDVFNFLLLLTKPKHPEDDSDH